MELYLRMDPQECVLGLFPRAKWYNYFSNEITQAMEFTREQPFENMS